MKVALETLALVLAMTIIVLVAVAVIQTTVNNVQHEETREQYTEVVWACDIEDEAEKVILAVK